MEIFGMYIHGLILLMISFRYLFMSLPHLYDDNLKESLVSYLVMAVIAVLELAVLLGQ